MAGQRLHGAERGKESSRRAEREQRVLDAAAELLQKWGYRKTTLDDVARQARVAKGTIYLHWRTRDELFMALIEREETKLFIEIARYMEEDPEGMTLPGQVKYSMLATLKNPLMRALALQDTEFLGGLVTRGYNSTIHQAQTQGYIPLLELLRDLGVIRNDIDLREQILTLAAVSWGFLLIKPLLPPDLDFASDEQMVERATATLKRLLEPDIPPTDEQRRAGKEAFRAYIKQVIEMSEGIKAQA